jgi:hypothetical protein
MNIIFLFRYLNNKNYRNLWGIDVNKDYEDMVNKFI